jgi:hypothetical protein
MDAGHGPLGWLQRVVVFEPQRAALGAEVFDLLRFDRKVEAIAALWVKRPPRGGAAAIGIAGAREP